MAYILVGLGNPGEEYETTRHNTGRIILEAFYKECNGTEWKKDAKLNALVSKGKCGSTPVSFVFPETFMNNSGKSVAPLVTSAKKAEQLVVVHDDLDLPMGTIKISFNRGPGGHNGVFAIQKSLKTEAFVRLRVGISPTTPGGKLRKPKGAEAVEKFILGNFSEKELAELKKVSKITSKALAVLISEGREKAMGEFN